MSTSTSATQSQYMVTSNVISLEQKVGGRYLQHDLGYPRTVEWLKDDENGSYLTQAEAESLKDYLDGKPQNFSDNTVVVVPASSQEFDIPAGTGFMKAIHDQRASTDRAIEVSQCSALADYKLPFAVRGYLNVNNLT